MPNNIITAQDFFDSGLPVSTDITEQEVTFAITSVEQFYVVPRIGDLQWAQLIEHPTDYDTAINGGTTLAGLKMAEYHLVFAYLLYDKIRLTRYSSVIKNDEHSTDPSLKDVRDLASFHLEQGEWFLRGVLKFLQIEDTGVRNNYVFGELLMEVTGYIHKH